MEIAFNFKTHEEFLSFYNSLVKGGRYDNSSWSRGPSKIIRALRINTEKKKIVGINPIYRKHDGHVSPETIIIDMSQDIPEPIIIDGTKLGFEKDGIHYGGHCIHYKEVDELYNRFINKETQRQIEKFVVDTQSVPEISEMIQKVAFANDIKWANGPTTSIRNINSRYLYIGNWWGKQNVLRHSNSLGNYPNDTECVIGDIAECIKRLTNMQPPVIIAGNRVTFNSDGTSITIGCQKFDKEMIETIYRRCEQYKR